MTYVAQTLTGLPIPVLAKLAYPASRWILRVAQLFQSGARTEFDALWAAMIVALSEHPAATRPATARMQGIDWASHSLNAPVGKLAEVLMKDDARPPNKSAFPTGWLKHAEELLLLPGDARRDAIVMFAFQLGWLHHHASDWTDRHLLTILESSDREDRRAFWDGFFWANKLPSQPLYMRLKPHLLNLLKNSDERPANAQHIAAFILNGWISFIEPLHVRRAVTDNEMREALLLCSEVLSCANALVSAAMVVRTGGPLGRTIIAISSKGLA